MTEKQQTQLIYAGRRFDEHGTKSRIFHMYFLPDNLTDPHLWHTSLGSRSKNGKDIIGGSYKGEANCKDGVPHRIWGTLSYDGMSNIPQDTIAQWTALDVAAEARLKAFKREKTDKKMNAMFEALAPLKQAYMKTNTTGKRAILAAIFEYFSR
jgi:hypothetical protein